MTYDTKLNCILLYNIILYNVKIFDTIFFYLVWYKNSVIKIIQYFIVRNYMKGFLYVPVSDTVLHGNDNMTV